MTTNDTPFPCTRCQGAGCTDCQGRGICPRCGGRMSKPDTRRFPVRFTVCDKKCGWEYTPPEVPA